MVVALSREGFREDGDSLGEINGALVHFQVFKQKTHKKSYTILTYDSRDNKANALVSAHQRQRAVGDMGEGSRSVEEAKFRPDSGPEENARIVVDPPPFLH